MGNEARPAGDGVKLVLAAGGIVAAVVVGSVVLAARMGAPAEVAASATPPSSPAPATLEEAPLAAGARQIEEMTAPEAIGYVRPLLATPSGLAIGVVRLLQWSAARPMRWPDVAVEETTLALAAKDIDASRGKRLCSSGSILQIQRDKELPGEPFVGTLNTGSWTALEFTAYGSTGKLVEGSSGRFCGVIVNQDAPGVLVVGMFDLPENHPAAATAAAAKVKTPARSAADRRPNDTLELKTTVTNPDAVRTPVTPPASTR